MLDTALAQLRVAVSLVSGARFAQWSLDWLVAAARDTRREFGPTRARGAELLDGPALDEGTSRPPRSPCSPSRGAWTVPNTRAPTGSWIFQI